MITERDVRLAELDTRNKFWDAIDMLFRKTKMEIRGLETQGRHVAAEALAEALRDLRFEVRRSPYFKETEL